MPTKWMWIGRRSRRIATTKTTKKRHREIYQGIVLVSLLWRMSMRKISTDHKQYMNREQKYDNGEERNGKGESEQELKQRGIKRHKQKKTIFNKF